MDPRAGTVFATQSVVQKKLKKKEMQKKQMLIIKLLDL